MGYHVLLKAKTESLPSEDAHANTAPSSCGAQDTELTVLYQSQMSPSQDELDVPEAV
jgi:hypothetical protein